MHQTNARTRNRRTFIDRRHRRSRHLPAGQYESNQEMADASGLAHFLTARGYAPNDHVRHDEQRQRRLRTFDKRLQQHQAEHDDGTEAAAHNTTRQESGEEQSDHEADEADDDEDEADDAQQHDQVCLSSHTTRTDLAHVAQDDPADDLAEELARECDV